MNGLVGGLDWTAGLILAVSFFILLPGVLMFWFRDGVHGGPPRSPAHYTLERSLVAAWVILTAIGFVLLQGAFQSGLGQTLAIIGGTAYVLASILLAASELLNPTLGYGKVYRLAAGYVVTHCDARRHRDRSARRCPHTGPVGLRGVSRDSSSHVRYRRPLTRSV